MAPKPAAQRTPARPKHKRRTPTPPPPEPAYLQRRAIALLIDVTAAQLAAYAISPLWMLTTHISRQADSELGTALSVTAAYWAVIPILAALLTIPETRTGQTFGKHITGIYVRTEDGHHPTFRRTTARKLLSILSGFAVLPLTFGTFGKNRTLPAERITHCNISLTDQPFNPKRWLQQTFKRQANDD